jgi:hypothetical protein
MGCEVLERSVPVWSPSANEQQFRKCMGYSWKSWWKSHLQLRHSLPSTESGPLAIHIHFNTVGNDCGPKRTGMPCLILRTTVKYRKGQINPSIDGRRGSQNTPNPARWQNNIYINARRSTSTNFVLIMSDHYQWHARQIILFALDYRTWKKLYCTYIPWILCECLRPDKGLRVNSVPRSSMNTTKYWTCGNQNPRRKRDEAQPKQNISGQSEKIDFETNHIWILVGNQTENWMLHLTQPHLIEQVMEGLTMLETTVTKLLTDASSKKLRRHSKLSKLECILQLTISRWQAAICCDWQSIWRARATRVSQPCQGQTVGGFQWTRNVQEISTRRRIIRNRDTARSRDRYLITYAGCPNLWKSLLIQPVYTFQGTGPDIAGLSNALREGIIATF